MSTTTTNFGWTVPQSTDLVKDGATAISALGSGIDTSFVDLKGGTTGQVLAKASNTDLDYTWTDANPGDITGVTAGTGISGGGTSGTVTVTNSMATAIDAKGDLIAGTGADAFARLAVGTNDQVLTADSTASTGMKWASPAGSSGPAFSAYLGSNQTGMPDSTAVKIQINTEVFDTDSCYDTSNYRFTPTKAGKYLVTVKSFSALTHVNYVLKNGSGTQFCLNGGGSYSYPTATAIIEMNGSSDYMEMWGFVQTASGSFLAGQGSTIFEAIWLRS